MKTGWSRVNDFHGLHREAHPATGSVPGNFCLGDPKIQGSDGRGTPTTLNSHWICMITAGATGQCWRSWPQDSLPTRRPCWPQKFSISHPSEPADTGLPKTFAKLVRLSVNTVPLQLLRRWCSSPRRRPLRPSFLNSRRTTSSSSRTFPRRRTKRCCRCCSASQLRLLFCTAIC